jgi:hypothetical protein
MAMRVVESTVQRPSRTSASKRFGRYRQETERLVREVSVKDDPALQRLRELFLGAVRRSRNPWETRQAVWDLLDRNRKAVVYSSEDIERFSLALSEFAHERWFPSFGGICLTALVIACRDSEYILHTAHLPPLKYLGFKFGHWKKLTVNGDVGNNLGKEMFDGVIVVNGNVGWFAGQEMKDGTIIVNGDAGEKVGARMQGGEIHLMGDYESISKEVQDGKIYHKGKLIVDK